MTIIKPTADERKKIRAEARKMGVLHNSLTGGRGNAIGMMGEHLVHKHIKGERVGQRLFDYDIIQKNGLTVDVKTTKATGPPLPHYVARIYGSEEKVPRLRSKCDVYYFVRCNGELTLATVIGWLPADEFFDRALFLPRGNVDPNDGKLSFADEFTLPISELYPPTTRITKKLLAARTSRA